MIATEEHEIRERKWYKAKDKRGPARYVLHITSDRQLVQYDGDEVRFGAKYPTRKMSAFVTAPPTEVGGILGCYP